MSVSGSFMPLLRTQRGRAFQPDCTRQSAASALSDGNGVNICSVVSSCSSFCLEWISMPDPAPSASQKQWHTERPSRPRIIPHSASPLCSPQSTPCPPSRPPPPQHWKSPSANSPHCWTCEPLLFEVCVWCLMPLPP